MIITRTTRNKKATTTSNSEKDVKTVTKRTLKSKDNNEKLNANKVLKQNQNVVPFAEKAKDFTVKNSRSKTVLGSKLHSTRKNSSSSPKTTVLSIKSPALRDRTNTTNELVATKINKESSNKNMKPVKRGVTKKEVKKKENKVSNKLKESIKKFVVERPRTQKEDVSEALDDQLVNKKHVTKITTRQANSKTNISTENKVVKDTELNSDKNETEIAKSVLNKTLDSQDLNSSKSRVLRSKNISQDDIEKLLNEDEEAVDNKSSDKITKNTEPNVEEKNNEQNKASNSKTELPNQELVKQNDKKNKFFKVKGSEEEIKPISASNKHTRRPTNNRKKGGASKKPQNNDSTFNLTLEENRKSMKISEKQLRPRANKNYCEISKLSETSTEKKEEIKENSAPNKDHNVPIYKTVSLLQEKVKDKEEIYEFPDDSQETDKKSKKRKKRVRKPANKGAKKATVTRRIFVQNVQKNPANKKVPLKVQFKVQDIEPANTEHKEIVNNFSVNITVPEHLHNAGDSTIGEASTIKILSNQKLEGSEKIDLTRTPPVPKTITSQLKLYGPKNVITSQPTSKYSNMVNHSLVRKDMSPISKLGDDFDMGSPWRPVDAFSRVKQLVHSTPQINRLPLMREKLIPAPKILSKNESIFSEDTIHVSHMNNNETLNTKEAASPVKKTDVSPRKFGTVISNLSPEQRSTTQSENNNVTPIANDQHSMQATSPLETSPVLPADQEKVSSNPVIQNKENKIPSPKKSPQKKYSTPSPFRFDRLRTSNRISAKQSQFKVPNSIVQKEDEKLEPEAGPSWLENPKPANLRQSNLNNFLNLDEMPESTRICTAHGIFNDGPSTPINNKKYKKVIEEANVENAFGFDDDSGDISPIIEHVSTPIFATEEDVRSSVKGKLFPRARVKSAVPSRISLNTVKKTLKNVLKKDKENKKVIEASEEKEENIAKEKTEKINKDVENNNEPEAKKAMLDAVSFSDTFDVISDKEEVLSKVSDNIPLFVDLEPVHFSKPPRRSYNKRKRAVYFDTSKDYFDSDYEEHEKPKPKKKKESKLSREEHKRMQEWVKSINNTFEEIEDFDLVVE